MVVEINVTGIQRHTKYERQDVIIRRRSLLKNAAKPISSA
jgi:hypothetical protein